jgi:hypothetical protein
MPCSASAGRSTRSTQAVWRPVCTRTSLPIAAIVSAGLRPSSRGRSMPASTYSCSPATRTMKNSSRLFE